MADVLGPVFFTIQKLYKDIGSSAHAETVALAAGDAAIGKLAANSGVDIGDVDVLTINSVAPQFDDTDKLAVSLYGKVSAAGDKEIALDGHGRVWVNATDAVAGSALPLARLKSVDAASPAGDQGVSQGVHAFNNSSWDRQRNNHAVSLLASAARTATLQSADQTCYNGTKMVVTVDISSITDTPSLTPYLQGKDSVSGNYFTIWTATAALTATGTVMYLFALGGSGSAGSYTEAVNLIVPRTWRLGMTHADSDSATYSVSADIIV